MTRAKLYKTKNMENTQKKPIIEKYEDSVYLHVCNGGATISIKQEEDGVVLKIRTSSYGNCIAEQSITMDNTSINALFELFKKASNHNFSVSSYTDLAKPIGCSDNSEDIIAPIA